MILGCDVSHSSAFQALKEKDLGNAAYKNKDFENALKHYDQALQHDPTNMTYMSNQAGLYAQTYWFLMYSHLNKLFKNICFQM